MQLLKRNLKSLDWPGILRDHYQILLHNIFPVIGVVWFGWDPVSVVFMYVAETIIAGFMNVPKILLARGQDTAQSGEKVSTGIAGKIFICCFFLFHYNFFIWGQLQIIAPDARGDMSAVGYFVDYFIRNESMQIGLLVALVSYTVSFYRDYIGRKQYLRFGPVTMMFMPYARIFIQQFVGIFGSFLVALFRLPILFLILLQVLKTAAEFITVAIISYAAKNDKDMEDLPISI